MAHSIVLLYADLNKSCFWAYDSNYSGITKWNVYFDINNDQVFVKEDKTGKSISIFDLSYLEVNDYLKWTSDNIRNSTYLTDYIQSSIMSVSNLNNKMLNLLYPMELSH